MEKDIDKITKNPDTEIVIRIDDFGGRKGLTIREFVRSERYSGFTKAGTRVPADRFKQFKAAINSINEKDLEEEASVPVNAQADTQASLASGKKESGVKKAKAKQEISGIEDMEM